MVSATVLSMKNPDFIEATIIGNSLLNCSDFKYLNILDTNERIRSPSVLAISIFMSQSKIVTTTIF